MIVLTASDVSDLIRMPDVITAVERAHREHADGIAAVPAPLVVEVPGEDSQFLAMGAVSARSRMAAVKLLADLPGNRGRGLPAQRSFILVANEEDGSPLALVDGGVVTRFRTAAASAVATRFMAREDAHSLGFIGAGALARSHLEAIRAVRDIDRVHIWSRTLERASQFADEVRALGIGVSIEQSPRDVVLAADILCTLTPSREPIVNGMDLKAGLHVNAVGAPPRPDHREIDDEGMRRSIIVVDSVETALKKSGEVIHALASGSIKKSDVRVELGQVIVGSATGRRNESDVTIFNSVGLGLQDLATVEMLLSRAVTRSVGSVIDLSA